MAEIYQLDAQSKKVLAMLDGPGIPQCSDMTPLEARDWMARFMDQMVLDRGGPKYRQMMLWYPGVGSAGDTQSMEDYSEG